MTSCHVDIQKRIEVFMESQRPLHHTERCNHVAAHGYDGCTLT
jgi:hypothetical protein